MWGPPSSRKGLRQKVSSSLISYILFGKTEISRRLSFLLIGSNCVTCLFLEQSPKERNGLAMLGLDLKQIIPGEGGRLHDNKGLPFTTWENKWAGMKGRWLLGGKQSSQPSHGCLSSRIRVKHLCIHEGCFHTSDRITPTAVHSSNHPLFIGALSWTSLPAYYSSDRIELQKSGAIK